MGDGGYDNRFSKFAEKYPNIDLAIMENGQYNEGWKAIHLLPLQLSDAIDELHPTHVLTYHHAKFKLSVHTWYEPLENIYNNSRGKFHDFKFQYLEQPASGIIHRWRYRHSHFRQRNSSSSKY